MERKFHVSNRKSVSRVKASRRRPGCIRLFVCPTTGGRLEISVSPLETVTGLKAALGRKLRVAPSKITLIYKNTVLKNGCLQDHHIPDESHVTLLPNMESGLSVSQSDRSIMQALENLTETQVNDFLSGRSPLMLAIRMGENMVFVQLQLSMLQGQRPAQVSPTANPMPPTAAISQSSLSPSAIAEATRCLSQRIHRLQELNKSSRQSTPSTSSLHRLSQAAPLSQPTPVSTPQPAAPPTPQTSPHQRPPALPSVPDNPLPSPPPSPGAVIDSMKHLGRGVYTGTFQGTLDPTLQDVHGQPRRSVSTILHILNDLLIAAPHSPAPVPNSTNPITACPCPSMLTPPSSPTSRASPVNLSENLENVRLRGKMQQIQKMLANKKEERRTRREQTAPYSTGPRSHQKLSISSSLSLTSSSLSSSASVCVDKSMSAVSSHVEPSTDQSSYCKPNIEQAV